MNKAYAFLLTKRYGHKWKQGKEKLKYYFDFSMVYIVLLSTFFFLFYRDMWSNPPLALQGIASFFGALPSNFWFSIALLLFLQSTIKGLTTPPIHYDIGDTYFLFALPIPKEQYIFFEWLFIQVKAFLILFLCFLLGGPIFHFLWADWLFPTGILFFQIVLFGISVTNIQWLSFQLPLGIKKGFLRIIRFIKMISFVGLGIFILVSVWLFLFPSQIPSNIIPLPPQFISFPFPSHFTLLLLAFCLITTASSLYFMGRTSLEGLKDSSLHQDRIKSLRKVGAVQEAKNLLKGKGKKEKRYFLSIPGFYKNATIFLWRNLTQLIKHPLQSLFPYGLYLSLGIGVIISTKGEAISLVFIFFALYILGQRMLSPLQEHFEANYFLSSFPMKSLHILRGYLSLPIILSTIMGIVISVFMGRAVGDLSITWILILNLPIFSYFTLLAAMKNVLEDMNLEMSVNKTLHMETMLFLQGAVPIVFGMLFVSQGIPLWIIGLCTALAYLLMSTLAEREVVKVLQHGFHKYS